MPSNNHLQDSKSLQLIMTIYSTKISVSPKIQNSDFVHNTNLHPNILVSFVGSSQQFLKQMTTSYGTKLGIHKDVASVNWLEKQGKFHSPETPFKRLAPMMHPYAHSIASHLVKDTWISK